MAESWLLVDKSQPSLTLKNRVQMSFAVGMFLGEAVGLSSIKGLKPDRVGIVMKKFIGELAHQEIYSLQDQGVWKSPNPFYGGF